MRDPGFIVTKCDKPKATTASKHFCTELIHHVVSTRNYSCPSLPRYATHEIRFHLLYQHNSSLQQEFLCSSRGTSTDHKNIGLEFQNFSNQDLRVLVFLFKKSFQRGDAIFCPCKFYSSTQQHNFWVFNFAGHSLMADILSEDNARKIRTVFVAPSRNHLYLTVGPNIQEVAVTYVWLNSSATSSRQGEELIDPMFFHVFAFCTILFQPIPQDRGMIFKKLSANVLQMIGSSHAQFLVPFA
mmetsp:Transcript_20631/g.44642  ORF Transcript_20631/g.44642 Transcript_20631/m.44642 type:complete len:241 (-) Transcript_20631:1409-2131(-)